MQPAMRAAPSPTPEQNRLKVGPVDALKYPRIGLFSIRDISQVLTNEEKRIAVLRANSQPHS
jgi:hypothetical protein